MTAEHEMHDAWHMRRLWLEKQERAFTAWLNHALSPEAAAGDGAGGGCQEGGLAGGRLAARVRGLIWRLYCGDAQIIDIVTRLEARIDEGFLRLKDEVLPDLAPSFPNAKYPYSMLWSCMHLLCMLGTGVAQCGLCYAALL